MGNIVTQPRLLHLHAMARRLRVPAEWLRTEAEAGRVPHLQAGNQLLFAPEAVEEVLVNRAKGGGLRSGV